MARSLSEQFLQDVNKKKIEHAPLNPEHIPYYLLNFEGIVRGVIDETDDKELFEEDEIKIVDIFRNLPLDARKIYVRLFQVHVRYIKRFRTELHCQLQGPGPPGVGVRGRPSQAPPRRVQDLSRLFSRNIFQVQEMVFNLFWTIASNNLISLVYSESTNGYQERI